MTDKLSPCPFCGGEADFCETGVWWVRCGECGTDAQCGDTREEAARLWNRRAALQSAADTPAPPPPQSHMKRYDVATVHKAGGVPLGEMVEHPDGEYVRFDDLGREQPTPQNRMQGACHHADYLEAMADVIMTSGEAGKVEAKAVMEKAAKFIRTLAATAPPSLSVQEERK